MNPVIKLHALPRAKKMKPIIKFQNIRKSYGDLVVLDNLNLEVMPNEQVAIIGPSGSGKSTLLRLLMTLERPDSGNIEVDGDSLWHTREDGKVLPPDRKHLREVRGKIGMVFQHFHLFPHMNVLRNITEAPVHVLGLPKKQAKERALKLLDMVGLSDKVDSYPDQLSGGQKQRVAIARALAMQPKILLFDEVTSALDPELVGEVLNVLRALAAKHDYTMLIVTHEMNFAREVSDRVCFFDRGRILEQDTPEQIFTEPRVERTREFLRAVLAS